MADPAASPEWLTWYRQAATFVREQAALGTVVERVEDPSGRSISFGRPVAAPPSNGGKR